MKAKKLFEIITGDLIIHMHAVDDHNVTGLTLDSRQVKEGFVYIAVKGSKIDGHQFIDDAIRLGARCIVCEVLPLHIQDHIVYVQVLDVRKVTALLAHHYYEQPSRKMQIIGVTGTNGKTTVATLLHQLFSALGHTCGLISTVENKIGNRVLPSTHTTPDPISLARLMHDMVSHGCDYVLMEVSSHALDQKRVHGIDFDVAIFTNISHDHLDYHETFLNYIRAKKIFFDELTSDATAIINIDDKNGLTMVQNTKAKTITYALHRMADYHTRVISNDIYGLELRLGGNEVICTMSGLFNAYNITAVLAAAEALGKRREVVIPILSTLQGAEGRMEKVIDKATNKIGIIDYAHTPDALQNVLTTIKESLRPGQSVITVIGCGGDRDKTKRPLMANIAVGLSHKTVLTSDNPRSEDPEVIIDDMMSGLSSDQRSNCVRITDRLMAIKTAVMLASKGDVILIAGKGHEKYQEIKGVKFPFEDKKALAEIFAGIA